MLEKILYAEKKLGVFSASSDRSVCETLKECLDAGYKPLFMPDLIRLRIANPEDLQLWESGLYLV